MKIILSLFLILCFTEGVLGQQGKVYEGRVLEKTSRLPIPYCSVHLIKGREKTFCDAEGEFVFGFLPQVNDSLEIRSVGFKTLKVSVNGNHPEGNLFFLEEDIASLGEVVITSSEGVMSILNGAITLSDATYAAPAILNGYYKECVKRDSLLSKYADGLISYYIERPVKGLPKVLLKVTESRVKEISLDEEDDKIDQLNSSISIEKMGEYSSPIKVLGSDTARSMWYNFSVKENANEGQPVYIISFEPKIPSKTALFCGKIYIDKNTRLIMGIDYAVAPLSIPYLKSISILGIKVSSTQRSISVRYKHVGNDYYLAYVGVNFGIKILSKRYNQNTTFKSEFWLIEAETKNCQRPTQNLYSKKTLYKRGTSYTHEFWKDYGFSENNSEETTFLNR